MKFFKCSSQSDVSWPLDCLEESITQDSEELKPDNQSADLVLDLGQSHTAVRWSELMMTVHSMLPSKAWNSLSPELYTTFWGLTLYDLYVPRGRYEAEITKQHAALKALEELSDNSSSAITKRKKDKERIQELLDKLTGELLKHEQHVASVNRRLSREKDGWLSSCSDMLKINVEFFQRCIFPRCIFSMSDAVYCAKFVHTLHLIGTPFFNTVHHIDIFICKTLQPMICCCTEFEAGRLGRFLYETLKMAYHWKSDEAVYERECGSKPGFAIYYRYPNSQRVTFGQFVRIHLKWSAKITKLFIQCLESTEYMEIRNSLITLTKISSIFPVTRKSGVNLEKRVAKIKLDEREDLKVLATGVSAALAARKSSWVSEEEFTMGYFVPKQPSSPTKSLANNVVSLQNGSTTSDLAGENGNTRNVTSGSDSLNYPRDQGSHAKLIDGRQDRMESLSRNDSTSVKVKGGLVSNNADTPLPVASTLKPSVTLKSLDDAGKVSSEEAIVKVSLKAAADAERPKRSTQAASSRQVRQELIKDDAKALKSITRTTNQSSVPVSEKDITAQNHVEGQRGGASVSVNPVNSSDVDSGEASDISRSRTAHSPFRDDSVKYADKQLKRPAALDEQDRLKRRKGENEAKDGYALDLERTGSEEHSRNKPLEKLLDKSKDKAGERLDKDHREKLDRSDRTRNEGVIEKTRDRSIERYGRERSVERVQDRGDRGTDRLVEKGRDDKIKDERNKTRHSDVSSIKQRSEDNLTQNLPPPPPLSPSTRPESVGPGRRDEEPDRRSGARHMQKLSPRLDEKDRRHLEENASVLQDETKRRRDDDLWERKHDEWDATSTKVEEQDRDKGNILKSDIEGTAASKKRKIKRDIPAADTIGREYSPAIPPLHPPGSLGNLPPIDGRERGERKAAMVPHRSPYLEETVHRLHGKEAASKITRREAEQNYERDWEEEKRLRNEAKRKHRK